MEIIQDIVKKSKELLEKCDDNVESIEKECNNYFKEVDMFLKTGNSDFFKPIFPGKENMEPIIVTNIRRGRPRKPALADVIENNMPQTEVFTIKKEKISDIPETHEESNINVQIKKEAEEMPAPTKLPPRKKKIKTENNDLPKRSTRARTKTKKYETVDDTDFENARSTKDSDIIIQNSTITTIEISDSEKETDSDIEKISEKIKEVRTTRSKIKKQNPVPVENHIRESSNKETGDEDTGNKTRNTRTKTLQKKRARSNSMEQSSTHLENKKSKSDSNTEKECNGSLQTDYEDAVSVIESNNDKPEDKPKPADVTYITSSKKSDNAIVDTVTSSANSTVIVENPKMVTKEPDHLEFHPSQNNKALPKTPTKPTNQKRSKQIFSPFEKTPVKKKVEAFEKLGVDSSGIPTRVTRTKKKTHKKDSGHNEDNEMKSNEKEKRLPEKEKVLTPITYKFVPKVCSTSKINKYYPSHANNLSTHNDSTLSVKSSSALKASQAEFREREKRRQEKEKEALRKREALLQAQTEEKRRKREEKQQRAQQQREILEKEMQKQLEAQRIKEEKYKLAMAEREKKIQKQKEEAEKKRQMVKKKATELLKEKEEVIRLAEQKKHAEMKAVLDKQGEMGKLPFKQKAERTHQTFPLYMTTKPPLLPTADCYDSDDSQYEVSEKVEPVWSKDKELREMQLAMITAGETIKNSFFCRQAQTPDLQEIFEIIDPRKLKRTSSAIWRKPPRFTLMPTLEDTIEFSEDSD